MWLLNVEKIHLENRINYLGKRACLLPVARLKFNVELGDRVILAIKNKGIVGYGQAISPPLKLSFIPKVDRKGVTNTSLKHVFVKPERYLNDQTELPIQILKHLPRCSDKMMLSRVGKSITHFIGSYAYQCICYLIEGHWDEESLLGSYLYPISKIDHELLARRLHVLYDNSKPWLKEKMFKSIRKTASRWLCWHCHSLEIPESLLQLHHAGSMMAGAKYSREDFQLLCPNCHAIEDADDQKLLNKIQWGGWINQKKKPHGRQTDDGSPPAFLRY
jgi:hypothetical protein